MALEPDGEAPISPDEGIGGPAWTALQTGETRVHEYCSRIHSQGGREHVKVRAVRDRGLGWVKAAMLWGAEVEAVFHRQHHNHRLSELLNHPKSSDVASAFTSTQEEPWNGILLSTVCSTQGSKDVERLLFQWRPLITIIALPQEGARAKPRRLEPAHPPTRVTPCAFLHPSYYMWWRDHNKMKISSFVQVGGRSTEGDSNDGTAVP